MAIEVAHFVQEEYRHSPEYVAVKLIGERLLSHLNSPLVLEEKIGRAHV